MSKQKDEMLEKELEKYLPPEDEEDEGYIEFSEDIFEGLDESEEEIEEETEKEEEKEEAIEELKEEEEEEEEKEKVKKKEEKEEKKEESKRTLPPEVEEILKQIPEDAEVKSKGMKFPAKALTQEEVLALLNKGFRFYQAMEELAQKEKELKNKEIQLDQLTQQLAQLQAKLMSTGGTQAEQTASRSLPPELQPSEYDDPSVAALKKVAREAWEKAHKLEESLTGLMTKQKTAEVQAQLFREIENAVNDFPLASPEEVLLVYLITEGKKSPREIAALSHKHRANMEYVKKLLTHVPEVKKMLEDEIIKDYLAKQKTKRVPIKSGTTKKVVVGKKEPEVITFDNISQILRQKLAQLKAEESEAEED